MYHPTVVGRRLYDLAQADRDNDKLDPRERFDPVDRTLAECDQMADHLISLINPDTARPRRPLRTEERKWIRHERLRCTADYRYWLEHYARINNYEGRLSNFSLNVAQEMIMSQWGDMENESLAIMLLALKARQLGASTITELAIQHRAQFYPDTNAVIASASPDQSAKMAHMMALCRNQQPWFLLPAVTAKNQRMIEFGGLNSAISIQHGTQFNGISRGSTPHVVHLSEIVDFDNAKELIEASLLRAIHETPWTFVVLESTAKGFFGYWPDKWKEVTAGWPKRQSRFCPIFLPWFVGSDLYPTEAWIRKQPIPGDWVPSEMVVAHAERAATYVSVNPLLSRHLGSGWRMSREQMWFYESEYAAAKTKRSVNTFLSEMPADPNEAWQSMDETAFDGEIIQFYRNDTGRRRPFGVFKFRGKQDEIPLVIQPHDAEVDTSRRPVELVCAWGSGQDKLTVDLVPVKYEGPGDDPDGKVFIYEPPNSQHDYGYGCDTSYGVGQDSSVIEMIRKASAMSAPAQVCEFASAWVGALSLWPVAMALGTLYSPQRKQCRATIECRGIGDTVQHELRKRGWSNFHPWTHIDNRVINLATPQKIGWFTNEAMREVLMDWVLSAVNDRWLELSSPYFVLEMSSLSKKQRQSYRAEAGAHDDRILSLGMILVSLHQHEKHGLKPGRIANSAWRPSSPEPEVVEDPVFDPGWQGRDMRDNSQIKGYLRTLGRYYQGVAKGETSAIKRGLGNTSYRVTRRAR